MRRLIIYLLGYHLERGEGVLVVQRARCKNAGEDMFIFGYLGEGVCFGERVLFSGTLFFLF